jgi:nitric oxide reductase
MINLGIVELLAHPEQLEALRADPHALLGPAVEEICRYHTASSFALRRWASGVMAGGAAGCWQGWA